MAENINMYQSHNAVDWYVDFASTVYRGHLITSIRNIKLCKTILCKLDIIWFLIHLPRDNIQTSFPEEFKWDLSLYCLFKWSSTMFPKFFHQREPSLLDAIESQSFSPILLGSLRPPYWVEVHSQAFSKCKKSCACLRLPRLDYSRHFITLKDRVNWMMISNEEQLKIIVLWYFFFSCGYAAGAKKKKDL